MAFVKLFTSILDSTVWHEPDHTRILWITLLAMADRHGEISSSIPGLATRAGIPIASVHVALETFLSPDGYSRTKEFEGRRIEEIDGGWRLLNYDKYRKQQSLEDARAKTAERVRRHRASRVTSVTNVTVTGVTPSNDIAEAEAEAEAISKASSNERTEHLVKNPKRKAGDFVSPAQATAFAEFWSEYPRKKAKPNAQKAYVKAVLTKNQHAAVMQGLRTQLPGMLADEPQHRPHPATWLNARRWEDEPDAELSEDARLEAECRSMGLL